MTEAMNGAAASARITHAVGLHARPSVKLTKLAKGFESEIRLRGGEAGAWVNAKSIVKVMALKAPANTTLVFEAEGADVLEGFLRPVVGRATGAVTERIGPRRAEVGAAVAIPGADLACAQGSRELGVLVEQAGPAIG